MDYQIEIAFAWGYRHPKRGRSLLMAGRYAVPDDVPEVVAQRAIAEGVGTRIELTRTVVTINNYTDKPLKDKPKRGRRKKPAPENKLRGHAPEDKSGVD